MLGGEVTQTHLQYVRRWCCNHQLRHHIVIFVIDKLHTCKTLKICHTTYDIRIESGHVHPSIIIKGLLNSNYHCVRYMEIKGDGDFSVMANMIENVLFYVHHLEKVNVAIMSVDDQDLTLKNCSFIILCMTERENLRID